MARSAEENALAAVEKAIKAHDTALEKAEAAQAKADELVGKANRADRELKWTASHPDLPEDFDLDAFRTSLAEPFDAQAEVASDVAISGEPDDAPQQVDDEDAVPADAVDDEDAVPADAVDDEDAVPADAVDDDDPFA